MKTLLRRLPLDQALSEHPCTCIDGRTRGERYSAAGGSFAVLAEALNAWQKKTGRALGEEEVGTLLDLFADKVSAVYLHTDEAALQRIFARLGLAPDTELRNLTPQQQKSFIELASRPDVQGCRHLTFMLEQPTVYGVSVRLIERLMHAFFSRWFAGKHNIVFEVLRGENVAEAVVTAEAESDRDVDQIALFCGPEAIFYINQPARHHLVQRFAIALVESGQMDEADLEDFIQKAVEHHDRSAGKSLTALTANLPKHQVPN